MKKALRWIGGILAIYVIFVFLFESVFLGYFQPSFEEGGIPMLDITALDESGNPQTRRLAWHESAEGKIYISAHHWTRGWYHNLRENPDVRADIRGKSAEYRAAIVTGEEFDQVAENYPLPFPVRFLMGFPPARGIMRLDPVSETKG